MSFDPRDFIQEPFWSCPRCREQAFGVLMVAGRSYVRRCRECWHTEQSPLPDIRKKVIYLDQNAISDVYRALTPESVGHDRAVPRWGEISERLVRLARGQLVVCPESVVHAEESSHVSYAEALRTVYERFSCGHRFLEPEQILGRQLLDRFSAACAEAFPFREDEDHLRDRSYAGGITDVVTPPDIHSWDSRLGYSIAFPTDDAWVRMLETDRDHAHAQLLPIFARWQSERSRTFQEWKDEELEGWRRRHLREHARLRLRNSARASGEPIPFEALGSTSETNLVTALHRYAVERTGDADEAASLVEAFLHSEAIADAPYLDRTTLLFAALARKAASGQTRPPSRGTLNDVRAIATASPYCDAIWVDNEFAGLLNEEPLRGSFGPNLRVFSARTRDHFLDYLEQIELEAPAEHWATVFDVYNFCR